MNKKWKVTSGVICLLVVLGVILITRLSAENCFPAGCRHNAIYYCNLFCGDVRWCQNVVLISAECDPPDCFAVYKVICTDGEYDFYECYVETVNCQD